MLQVRVPVLSEKTYSTMPSSSTRLDVLQFAGVSVLSWYMSRSSLMSTACQSFTSSRVTKSEMGTSDENRTQ